MPGKSPHLKPKIVLQKKGAPRFFEVGLNELLFLSKLLLTKGKVVVSPGIGFGDYGDDWVRFALVENKHRILQATRGIRNVLRHPQKEARK